MRCSSDSRKSPTWASSYLVPDLANLFKLLKELVKKQSDFWGEQEASGIVPRESKARLKPTLQCLSFMLLKKRMWFNVTPLWMVLELAFFRMAIQWHIHLESSLSLRSTTTKLKKNCYQLSLVFERCLYRGKVFIQTDHKPLKSIMKKSLLSAPKRLQRMLLRLQKSELTVRAPRCLLQIRLAKRIPFHQWRWKSQVRRLECQWYKVTLTEVEAEYVICRVCTNSSVTFLK